MLISDLGAPLEAACGGVLVEREQLGFMLAEQLIGNPNKPPSTDKMIAHNREVGGSLTVAGATATLTVNVKNVATGTTRSVTRSAPTDRFFELVSSVVEEVVRLICGGKPPSHYSGPVSGSISVKNAPDFDTFSWSGNVRLKYTGNLEPENAGEPPGEYAIYEPESGSIHVIVDGAQRRRPVPLPRRGGRHDRPGDGRAGLPRPAGGRPTDLLAVCGLPDRHPADARHGAGDLRRRLHQPVPAGGPGVHGDPDEPALVVLGAR